MSTKSISIPRARSAYSGPTAPACSRHVVTTRSPGRQSIAPAIAFMPSVVEWVSAMAAGSVVRTAATEARASAIRWRTSGQSSTWARPVVSSQVGEVRHRGRGFGGIGPTEPVLR